MRMGLREANQMFSKVIKAVRKGEEVILTERGNPIAVISPVIKKGSLNSMVYKLEESGLLRPAVERKPLPSWTPRKISGVPLSKTIQEDRERNL